MPQVSLESGEPDDNDNDVDDDNGVDEDGGRSVCHGRGGGRVLCKKRETE